MIEFANETEPTKAHLRAVLLMALREWNRMCRRTPKKRTVPGVYELERREQRDALVQVASSVGLDEVAKRLADGEDV